MTNNDFIVFTDYVFNLLVKMISIINSSFLLQFGVLLFFAFYVVSCLKKIMSDDDTDSKGGVSL